MLLTTETVASEVGFFPLRAFRAPSYLQYFGPRLRRVKQCFIQRNRLDSAAALVRLASRA
jgi:hypothetical protein